MGICCNAFDQHKILFFIHVAFTAIVPGAYPGEAKMSVSLKHDWTDGTMKMANLPVPSVSDRRDSQTAAET